MSNRDRRRSVYVRSGNDVVIFGARLETGFTKFPLDWPKSSCPVGNTRETRRKEATQEAREAGEVVRGWAAEGSEPIVAQPGLRQDKYPPRACAVDLVARNQQSR